MHWHLIEGEAGCRYAVEKGCVAIVVDALRASATAAALLHAGAKELQVVRKVEEAFAAKEDWPNAMLYGERGGLPLDGFDYGNSPREAEFAKGRRVVFTTTTGAGRMVQAWGAHALYMGTTVNASAVVRVASAHGKDVVVIPAGLMTDPAFNAQEDWAAATVLARMADRPVGEGVDLYRTWSDRIDTVGVGALFASAPHAQKLRNVHLEADIPVCAQLDAYPAVPMAVHRTPYGCLVRSAT